MVSVDIRNRSAFPKLWPGGRNYKKKNQETSERKTREKSSGLAIRDKQKRKRERERERERAPVCVDASSSLVSEWMALSMYICMGAISARKLQQ